MATRAGASQVAAVEAALEEYLQRLNQAIPAGQSSTERAAGTLAALRAGLTDEDRDEIRRAMDEMYDDAGLPVR